MINLPTTTAFNKRIPKQKFYENLSVTPVIRRCFVEQIQTIYWRNKLAPSTVNLAPGETVTEIEVFEIRLLSPTLDEDVLRLIDRQIPYHILYLLQYDGRYQAWIGYKQAAGAGSNAFKVGQYYHTDWLAPDDLTLPLQGLSMDAVYENLVRRIAGSALTDTPDGTLRQAVEQSAQREKLQRQIAALQNKIRREKQLNRQMEMNTQLKKLRKQLEEL